MHRAIAEAGYDVVPIRGIRHPAGRRARLLRALAVTYLVDVGANTGQFAAEVRATGFKGSVLSIEPLRDAYAALERRARGDDAWMTLRCAVGTSDGDALINVAGNSASSSFLPMLPVHARAAPGTAYVGHERTPMRRLESVLDEMVPPAARAYLKVDSQGYDLEVLRGAGRRLASMVAIQVELSLIPLYAGAPLADEVDRYLRDAGYSLVGIEPGFTDPESGTLLQMDGIYARAELANELVSST